MTRREIATCCVWVGFPLAGVIVMATWYHSTWYYYDEWSTIDRSLGGWGGLVAGHQGHLSVFSFIVYRMQRAVFGLDGHEVVWLAFMASVVAVQVTLAMLLRRLGLSTLFAMLGATFVTFFGPGAQDTVWEFQWNINLAFALSFLAAFVALREQKTERSAIEIAVLLVLAAAADSGLAIFGAVLVAAFVVFLWPRRLAIVALAPAAVVHLAWFAFGDQGPSISSSFDKVWALANRLFLYSAAAFLGAGETHTNHEGIPKDSIIPVSAGKVGLAVLLVVGAVIVWGLVRFRLPRQVLIALGGGLLGALLITASIAKTRAFITPPSQLWGSRYIQWVAFFLLIACAPAIVAVARASAGRWKRPLAVATVIVIVGAFAITLDQFSPVLHFYETKSEESKAELAEVVTALNEGCSSGDRPQGDTQPNPELNPQITVRLVRELLADGSIKRSSGVDPTPETLRAVCGRER